MAITSTVISTTQREQIDGDRFNEFQSNVDVQAAMDG